jgi:hypothetical protein
VKNRFQSLPFKCNLQRYATELTDGVWYPIGGFDKAGRLHKLNPKTLNPKP